MNLIKDLNIRFIQQASAIGMNHLTDIETSTADAAKAAMIVYLAINEISETSRIEFIKYSGINITHYLLEKLKRNMNTIERLAVKEIVSLIKDKLPVKEIDKIIK